MLAFVPPFSDKIRNQCANYVQKSLMKDFFIFSSLVGNWSILEMCTAALQHIFFLMKSIIKIYKNIL